MAIVDNKQSILYALTTTQTRDTSGALATVSDVADGASTAASVVPGVGTAIAAIIQTLSSLFGLIKGTTQHLSFQQVEPQAKNFEALMYPKFLSAYGAQKLIELFPRCRGYFLNTFPVIWGTDTPGSRTALANIQQASAAFSANPSSPTPLSWLMYAYVLYVGMNLDADAGQDTQRQYFQNVYDRIFTRAITDLGLDATKTAGTAAVDILGGGTGSTPGTGTGKTLAGLTAGTVVLIVAVALVFMLMRKG